MKGFLITLVVFVGFLVWFKDWSTSGKMDAYISQHQHPVRTPQLLNALGEFYFLCQEHKTAAHYYRWILEQYPNYGRMDRVHWRLGTCMEQTGHRPEAANHYRIVKDSFTASEYHTVATNRYNQLRF